MSAFLVVHRGPSRPPCSPLPCWRPAASSADAATARGRGQAGAAAPVATVNGTPIIAHRIRYLPEESAAGQAADLTPEQKNQVLDEMISMQLMAAQAEKDGLDKDPDTAGAARVLHMRVLADAESQKFLKGKEPTDARIARRIRDRHRARWTRPNITPGTSWSRPRIRPSRSSRSSRAARSSRIWRRPSPLDTGSKANGGDLGWFTTSRMVKPFADAVKALKKGEITPQPVQTQYGWHVIQLEDTRDAAPPPFDQVKQQLTNARDSARNCRPMSRI